MIAGEIGIVVIDSGDDGGGNDIDGYGDDDCSNAAKAKKP